MVTTMIKMLLKFRQYLFFHCLGVDFKVKTIAVDGNKAKLAIWVSDPHVSRRWRLYNSVYFYAYCGGHIVILVFNHC